MKPRGCRGLSLAGAAAVVIMFPSPCPGFIMPPVMPACWQGASRCAASVPMVMSSVPPNKDDGPRRRSRWGESLPSGKKPGGESSGTGGSKGSSGSGEGKAGQGEEVGAAAPGAGRRRSSLRFNKTPEEAKKEPQFSPKDHFYTGKIGIGTYAWGDGSQGFFDGDYPRNAFERSQLPCGAFNEKDIEEAFTFLEEHGLPMFDARELKPCEAVVGEMVAHWKKRQLKLQNDVKQVRPYIATSYQARLFGRGAMDVRGGRRALMRALERSLEHLQSTRVDLYQVTRPSALYWGGERALFDALAQAKQLKLIDHVGLIGYSGKQLEAARERARGFGIEIKSNSVELSLANPTALSDGTLDACQRMGIVAFANRPLGGGLASGVYTMMDPNGGLSRKPRYDFHDLEPLYPVHKALREVASKYSERLGKRVSTAHVSLNWVRSKGAVPMVGVNTGQHAKDVLAAIQWDLEPEDSKLLEDVAVETFKKRNKVKEVIQRARH